MFGIVFLAFIGLAAFYICYIIILVFINIALVTASK